jgi:hypothetical protein
MDRDEAIDTAMLRSVWALHDRYGRRAQPGSAVDRINALCDEIDRLRAVVDAIHPDEYEVADLLRRAAPFVQEAGAWKLLDAMNSWYVKRKPANAEQSDPMGVDGAPELLDHACRFGLSQDHTREPGDAFGQLGRGVGRVGGAGGEIVDRVHRDHYPTGVKSAEVAAAPEPGRCPTGCVDGVIPFESDDPEAPEWEHCPDPFHDGTGTEGGET